MLLVFLFPTQFKLLREVNTKLLENSFCTMYIGFPIYVMIFKFIFYSPFFLNTKCPFWILLSTMATFLHYKLKSTSWPHSFFLLLDYILFDTFSVYQVHLLLVHLPIQNLLLIFHLLLGRNHCNILIQKSLIPKKFEGLCSYIIFPWKVLHLFCKIYWKSEECL